MEGGVGHPPARMSSANSLYIGHGQRNFMPTKYDVVKQTKAPISKAIDYYSHPENLPKVHPDFVKEVKIISRDGNTIKLEQQMEMMGRKIKAVNTMVWDSASNKFMVNTLEGDGKGSKITIELKQIPTGTEMHYW